MNWWQEVKLDEIGLTATPARHYTGRGLSARFTKKYTIHWCSWCIVGKQNKIFFCGDSGAIPHFTETGNTFGGFDLTLMPIGAYDEAWPEIHTNSGAGH